MQILTRLNKVIAYSEQGYIPVGNSAVCVATQECHNDALIVTVDCVPTDIDSYNYYYINGKFIKEGPNSVIREVNHHDELWFWVGTQEEYAKLTDHEKQGLFAIITNDTTKEGIENSIAELQTKFDGLENGSTVVGNANKATVLNPNSTSNVGGTDYTKKITETGVYIVVCEGGSCVIAIKELNVLTYGSSFHELSSGNSTPSPSNPFTARYNVYGYVDVFGYNGTDTVINKRILGVYKIAML